MLHGFFIVVVCVCCQCLQIGIKSEWRGPLGRIVFFVGNKNTGLLQGVRAVFLPPPHMRVQASRFPDAIPPRAQVHV